MPKTIMKDARNNLMVRYLLGDLPESEQAALEELCFTDNETFDRMWENENRLVDDYVRGKLTSVDRARFEEHYLASPVHRRRVTTARNLIAAADEYAYKTPKIRPSILQRLTRWSHLSPTGQLAMAATLLLMAGVIWLLVEQSRLRGELANLQTETAARQSREQELARRIEAEQSERNQLAAELDRLRKQQTEPRPAQNQTPQPSMTIFSFVLSPVGVRGSAGQPLAVPPDADQVQLRLTVPPGDWQSFQAVIQTAERQPVWSQRQLKPRVGQVIVDVPAGKLSFDDYILTLSGINRAGATEEIDRYAFRISRK